MFSCHRRNHPGEENDEVEEPVLDMVSKAVQTANPPGMRWRRIIKAAKRLARVRRIWCFLGMHIKEIKDRGRSTS
jgi:hypothetical protein